MICIRAGNAPDKLLAAAGAALNALHADRVALAFFEPDRARKDRRGVAYTPFVDDELVADIDAVAVFACEAETVFTALHCSQRAGPPCGCLAITTPFELSVGDHRAARGRAFEVRAFEEFDFEAFGSAGCVCAQRIVGHGHFGRPDQSGALHMDDVGIGIARADSVENGHRLRRRPVIISDQRVETVRIGADDGNRLRRALDRQQAARVLEEDHRGLGGLARQRMMRGGGIILGGDFGERQLRIEQPQTHARLEQAPERAVDDGLWQEPGLHRRDDVVSVGRHVVAVIAADQVHARLETDRNALGCGLGIVQRVGPVDVRRCPAVRNDIALEAPGLAQVILHQHRTGAARHAVDGIVHAHHRLNLAFGRGHAERREIGILEVIGAGVDVLAVPVVFGSAVHGKVFRRRDDLVIFGVVALEARDVGDAQPPGQIRVFAVSFLATAPARVAEDVDVGRPDRQPAVEFAAAVRQAALDELGAEFGRHRVAHGLEQFRVPGRRHTDGLRKDRGDACTRHAVQPLIPPIIFGYAKPGDGGGGMAELCRLFLQRHARNDVCGTLLCRRG